MPQVIRTFSIFGLPLRDWYRKSRHSVNQQMHTRHSITDFPALKFVQEVRSFFTLSPHGRLMIDIMVLFTRYDFFLNHLKTEAGPLDF